MKPNDNPIIEELIERFLRYTCIPSQSDASSTSLPSSPGQMELAKLLKEELEGLGLTDILLTEDANLTAKLEGKKDAPAIGFVAHLDTVDVGLSDKIKAQVLFKEKDKDLLINKEREIYLKEELIKEVRDYPNEHLLVSDGTSVLGADNKAAISIIMTILNNLDNDHGDLYVAFVPDEEIGLRGSKALDPKRLPVTCAYTIDSNKVGEIIYETFNAGSALLEIEGISAHPMSAKGVLVNPLMIANEAINMLDPAAMPEHTELREGYIWPTDLVASDAKATLRLNIRDHDKKKYEEKKKSLERIQHFLQEKHPRVEIKLTMEDVYSNILDALESDNEPAITLLKKAMENLSITPQVIAMRGGTDGSALSQKGIPTPNYFTGAHQFHSAFEFLPLSSFYKSFEVTRELIRLWSNEKR